MAGPSYRSCSISYDRVTPWSSRASAGSHGLAIGDPFLGPYQALVAALSSKHPAEWRDDRPHGNSWMNRLYRYSLAERLLARWTQPQHVATAFVFLNRA